ncbi:MAG TPA: nitrous oxide reductase accessory protein NosL [Chryseosolibacter sp.]
MKKLKPISRVLILISALAMVSAYFVPLWQILMWAPQYPEGLQMKIWIDNITGDVRIISALNHYIGMKHIEVSMFPEFGYMIYIVGAIIGLGILATLVNKRILLVLFATCILAGGVAALVDFYLWGYDYGHNLDPSAPIVVPGMSYQPPLIGTKQLLNFTAYSGPDVGGWIFLGAGLLAIGTLTYELYLSKMKTKNITTGALLLISIMLIACSVEPEPLQFGKDGCHYCKMTLMDNKFGAEIVTSKGKIYKFDDVNCMLNFHNSGQVQTSDMKNVLIIDFSQPEKLIDARNALYVKSGNIKSPMASGIAAFESNEELLKLNGQWKGIVMSWGELQTQFK